MSQLGADDETLDGPFLLPSRALGLLVSLRGSAGGALSSASELKWGREVPAAWRAGPVEVFVRRGARALYLGSAAFDRRGKPKVDGFKALFVLEVPLEEACWRALAAEADAPLPAAAEEAIASLPKVSTTGQRLAAAGVFLERWFGPATAAASPVVSGPTALVAFHRLLAGRDVCTQNRLVPAHALALDPPSGLLPVYLENQSVFVWGTDASGEDPPVYVREGDGPNAWRLESHALSAFLLQVLVFEATFAAPHGANTEALDRRGLARLARRVAPLPLPDWKVTRTRFFGAGGVIAIAVSNGEDFSVWLGARERERLEPLQSLVGDWSEVRI